MKQDIAFRNNEEVARTRKIFWEKGAVDAGELPESILQSWQRCRGYGLEPSHKQCGEVPERQVLAQILERNALLMNAALPVMQSLREQTEGTHSAILLTDAGGTIVAASGDVDLVSRAKRVGARPGVSWNERDRGTNAMGTALAERRPVVVHGSHHYLAANSIFSCAAAPVFDPSGEILGTVDLSGDSRVFQPHALSLVRMSVQLIENHLFAQFFPESLHLRFHARPEFIGTLCEGLVAIGGGGRVLAANRAALVQLGLTLSQIQGRSVTELCDIRFEDFLTMFRSATGPVRVRLYNGFTLFAKVVGGGLVLRSPEVRAPDVVRERAPKRDRLPLDELDTGEERIRNAIQKVRRVIGRDINILIQGETGAGKEVLAKAIHEESPRSKGDFVAINCASIPEGLIESELFGYEEGAFTGARRKGYLGKVLQASGGTLFLDEIGDMPLHLQARLLRVIQERSVTPLGGGKPIAVDFSLICATHHRLSALVAENRFREDLYYRLKGLVVNLPALRERKDFRALVERILRLEEPERLLKLDEETMEHLERYAWPGNLRELHNVLRNAVSMLEQDERVVAMTHLPEDFLDEAQSPVKAPVSEVRVFGGTGSGSAAAAPPMDLESLAGCAIRQAMEANGGNIAAVARQLGVSRNTIYRKLKR